MSSNITPLPTHTHTRTHTHTHTFTWGRLETDVSVRSKTQRKGKFWAVTCRKTDMEGMKTACCPWNFLHLFGMWNMQLSCSGGMGGRVFFFSQSYVHLTLNLVFHHLWDGGRGCICMYTHILYHHIKMYTAYHTITMHTEGLASLS